MRKDDWSRPFNILSKFFISPWLDVTLGYLIKKQVTHGTATIIIDVLLNVSWRVKQLFVFLMYVCPCFFKKGM